MKIRIAIITSLLVVTAFAAPAAAQGGNFTLGVRAACGLPFGTAGDGWKLGELTTFGVPVQVDADFRLNENWQVGGYFSYGPVTVADEAKASLAALGLSDIGGHRQQRVGAQVTYDVLPQARFSPWVGLSAGYEWTRYAGAKLPTGMETEIGMAGFDAAVQLGGAFKVSPRVAVGPYVALDLGQFRQNLRWEEEGDTSFTSIGQKATHQWVRFGFKMSYVF